MGCAILEWHFHDNEPLEHIPWSMPPHHPHHGGPSLNCRDGCGLSLSPKGSNVGDLVPKVTGLGGGGGVARNL